MKGTRIAALVLSIINAVYAAIVAIIVAVGGSFLNVLSIYYPANFLKSMQVTYCIIFIIIFAISAVDIALMGVGSNSAIVLVFGIISILFGNWIAGILMCVNYGLSKKAQNSINHQRAYEMQQPVQQPVQRPVQQPIQPIYYTPTTPPVNKFCGKCGAEIKNGDMFCTNCGSRVE